MAGVVILSNHFSGRDAAAGLDLKALNVTAVVTSPPEVNSSGVVSGLADFSSLGVPLFYASSYNLKDDEALFTRLAPEVLLVMGYQRLVPANIIRLATRGAFGFHGSSEPLPQGRGRSPINWEIIKGKRRFILHMFSLEAGADEGAVADRYLFEMNEFDTVTTVYHKVSLAMRSMIERVVPPLLRGERVTLEPQRGEPTFFTKRTPEDGKIDWHRPTQELHNFIRALTRPYPGAFSSTGGGKLTIWGAQPFSESFILNGSPGEVLEVFAYRHLLIRSGDGALLVTEYEGETPQRGELLR